MLLIIVILSYLRVIVAINPPSIVSELKPSMIIVLEDESVFLIVNEAVFPATVGKFIVIFPAEQSTKTAITPIVCANETGVVDTFTIVYAPIYSVSK